MGPEGLVVSISLEGLEAYAIHLHKSLRDEELVTKALDSLLDCAGGLEASELGEVVEWCLEDSEALLRSGAPKSALRLLLLERCLAASAAGDPACEELLAAAPALLCSAGPEQSAAVQRLAAAVALALPNGAQAAEWLRPLRREADFAAYAVVAAAVLARHQDTALQADAWEAAARVMMGPNAAERRACMQHLLPTLVSVSAAGPAGLHGVAIVLLRGQSRAEVADALTLTVSFHEVLLARWRLASPDGDHDPLAVELVLAGLRSGLKEATACRKSARFLLETAVRAFQSDPRTPERLEALGVAGSELADAWRSFWELSDGLEASSSHLLKASWEPSMAQIRGFLEKTSGSADRLPACVLSQQWLEALLCRALGHANDSVSKFVLTRLLEPQRPPGGSAAAEAKGATAEATDWSPEAKGARAEATDWPTKAKDGKAEAKDARAEAKDARAETKDAKERPLPLSKDFVVGELLPRLSRCIEALYPKGDLQSRFESQVRAFFSSFIAHSSCGPQTAARALLLALFDTKPLHHTPLRLILGSLLATPGTKGSIGPGEALRLATLAFASILEKMPVSMRSFLGTLLLCSVAVLADVVDSEGEGEVIASMARTIAAIPDNLIREDNIRHGVHVLLRHLLDGREASLLHELLRGLASPRRGEAPASPVISRRSAFGCGADALPIEAVQLTLGAVRAFWAIDGKALANGRHAASSPSASTAPPPRKPKPKTKTKTSAEDASSSSASTTPSPPKPKPKPKPKTKTKTKTPADESLAVASVTQACASSAGAAAPTTEDVSSTAYTAPPPPKAKLKPKPKPKTKPKTKTETETPADEPLAASSMTLHSFLRSLRRAVAVRQRRMQPMLQAHASPDGAPLAPAAPATLSRRAWDWAFAYMCNPKGSAPDARDYRRFAHKCDSEIADICVRRLYLFDPLAIKDLSAGATPSASSTTTAKSNKSCGKYVAPALSGGLCRLSWSDPLGSLPRRAIVASLFGAAYSIALLDDGPLVWEAQKDAVDRLLVFSCKRAASLLRRDKEQEKEELPWAWLYALTLERFLKPDSVEVKALMHQVDVFCRVGDSVHGAVSMMLLGALCLKDLYSERRLDFVRRLMRPRDLAEGQEDSSIVEELFAISGCSAFGSWSRSRAEEYADLHRPEREGVGRIFERRDLREVCSTARWRCLAAVSKDASLIEALIAGEDADSGDGWTPWQHAQGLLDEFSTLQPADMARWAVIVRRFALQVLLDVNRPEEEQRGAFERLCVEISGALAGMAGGSVQVPRGCMQDLAAALCDARMWQAECRLCRDLPPQSRPLSSALLRLLALGETSPGPSRCLAVPLLAALLQEPRPMAPQPATDEAAAELLVALLLHKEGTIVDGVWCHAPLTADWGLDEDGPGSWRSLASLGPGAPELVDKFHFTACLCRVLALAGLDALADRAAESKGRPAGPPQLIRCVVRALLARMRRTIEQLQRPGGGKTPMPMSEQHCAQLRGWQALLVLGGRADRKMAAELLPELFFHLSVPHVPDVRDYQELLACALCSKYEDLAVECLLLPALRDFDAPIQVSASLLVVAAYLLRCWVERPRKQPSKDAAKLLPPHLGGVVCACLPYVGHNSAYVRGVAAWGLFHALQALGSGGLERHFPEGTAATLAETHRFLATNRRCGNIRDRLQPVFMAFDPSQRCLLSCLLSRSLVLSSTAEKDDEAGEFLHNFSNGDFHPTALFLDVVKTEVAHEMQALEERADPTTYPSSSDEWRARLAAASATAEMLQEAEATCSDPAAGGAAAERGAVGLQRKFEPRGPLPDADLAGRPAEEQAARSELVVVASLVDIPANLAGLCRTCEVLGCKSLWLANAQVTKDSAFQTVSVKSEKWLPIEEVPRAALRERLRRMRQRGYAIIGVEQTHDSVLLDEYRFLAKTVLVLGNEKAGIDAALLPVMDECVEIPQTGQLRSLNVHASGVVAVWEYVRQQRSLASGGLGLFVGSAQ